MYIESATALSGEGLADVPGSHLTRVELVIDALTASWPPLACSSEQRDEHYKIDALTGRRGGPYAEIGSIPQV